jgi:hypothetical protein
MNAMLQGRLLEHVGPHECSPYNGGCDLPHFRFNFVLPTYVARWPRESLAARKLEQVREHRAILEAFRE